jgi:hypothetical protein
MRIKYMASLPAQAPDGHRAFNATRPIPGHETWAEAIMTSWLNHCAEREVDLCRGR